MISKKTNNFPCQLSRETFPGLFFLILQSQWKSFHGNTILCDNFSVQHFFRCWRQFGTRQFGTEFKICMLQWKFNKDTSVNFFPHTEMLKYRNVRIPNCLYFSKAPKCRFYLQQYRNVTVPKKMSDRSVHLRKVCCVGIFASGSVFCRLSGTKIRNQKERDLLRGENRKSAHEINTKILFNKKQLFIFHIFFLQKLSIIKV